MEENTNYLKFLAKKYPTKSSVQTRLTELNAQLNLPKGTEHFMSDLHGEAEAFLHIRKNSSGVIKNKVIRLFPNLTEEERSELLTLIYYPEEKLRECRACDELWYETAAERIVKLLQIVGEKYSISDFNSRIAGKVCGFEPVIEELVWGETESRAVYKSALIKSAVQSGAKAELIAALSEAVKILVVDRLHVVGDIFDRGSRPDLIIDELMKERSVDIEWGNHDVLWMGAAAGSMACAAAVLGNSLTYGNLDVLEFGYGISLRPLAAFAEETYGGEDASAFLPRGDGGDKLGSRDKRLVALMNKAAAIIRFKLEGTLIIRNPHFLMKNRLFLDKLDKKQGEIAINSKKYKLKDAHLPTINENVPYDLSAREEEIISYYKTAFSSSQRLRSHIEYLYRVGSIYKIYNGNLLFHGCVPLNPDGSLMKLSAVGGLSGKALMDHCDRTARDGYFGEGDEKRRGEDLLWFLGCGRNSPLVGREKMATFERLFLEDEEIKKEEKNAYYKAWENEDIVQKILAEFGLFHDSAHIINGHIPQKKGENPIKAGGRLIVIDGGFCSAYHKTTGIAGYTLIYNADGMRLSAHSPFKGKEDAIKNNGDILSETVIFETKKHRIRIRETDLGGEIREEMYDLARLLEAYKSGLLSEQAEL